MFLFSTNTNPKLAKKVTKMSHLRLGRLEIKTFSDGEFYVRLKEKVHGQVVWVLASTMPPSDNLVKLLILLNALKSNGVKKINLIIPYFGYSRQDHINQPGAPLTAKLMAEILGRVGGNRIIAIDLHSDKVSNFFKVPLNHLSAISLFAKYFKKIKNPIIVSPDKGGIERASHFAKLFKTQMIALKKYRPRPNVVTKIIFPSGANVRNKNVIIVDDLIDTADTICKAAESLKKHGAKNIFVCATHGVFSGPAISRIKKSPIKKVIITDTFPLPKENLSSKIKIVSVANLLARLAFE